MTIRITTPLIKQSKEDWINRKWRPMMAWIYMGICIFDFIIAPTVNFIFFANYKGEYIAWKPLTMTDGGLFHLAMGAVLGITAWTRGQEKIRAFTYRNEYDHEEERTTYRDYRDKALRDSSREN